MGAFCVDWADLVFWGSRLTSWSYQETKCSLVNYLPLANFFLILSHIKKDKLQSFTQTACWTKYGTIIACTYTGSNFHVIHSSSQELEYYNSCFIKKIFVFRAKIVKPNISIVSQRYFNILIKRITTVDNVEIFWFKLSLLWVIKIFVYNNIVNKTFPKAGKESFQKVTLVYFFLIMFLATRATLNSVLYDKGGWHV